MAEVKNNDLQETRFPQAEQFQKILPETGTTIEEARSFWNETFKDGLKNSPAINSVDMLSESKESYSEKKYIDDKPRIIEYRHTRNESLDGDRHPITGIEFKRKIVEHPDGHLIEGVFPIFDSLFDAKIPENVYFENNPTQFKFCNEQLLKAIETDPLTKERFTEEQIEQIRDGVIDGTAPDGFVWHHNEDAGVIQLVDATIHMITGHTGGRSIWGGGYCD